MQIIKLTSKSALGLIEMYLEFSSESSFSGTKYYKITDFDEITIGSDEDSDILMTPGEVKASFHMPETLAFILSVLADFESIETTLRIYVGGEWIWSGYVEKSKSRISTAKKILTIQGYDHTKNMLEQDPTTNPMGYTLTDYKKITDIVSEPFTTDTIVKYPIINNVVSKSTLQARIGTTYFSFTDFYSNLAFYYNSNSNYSNMASMLKQIMLNYNLIGYLGLDRNLYLFPRFAEYPGSDIYTITRDEWADFPEYEIISARTGMQVKLWAGGYPKTDDSKYGTKTYGTYSEDDDDCESLIIDQPCGYIDSLGEGASQLFVYNSGTLTGIDPSSPGNIRRMLWSGSYSDWGYLWVYVASDTWEYIKVPRAKCTVKLKGSYNKWKPKLYYMFNGDTTVWRAQCFKYNLIDNITELYLRKAM